MSAAAAIEIALAGLELAVKWAPGLIAELSHHASDAEALATARARLSARSPAVGRVRDIVEHRRAELRSLAPSDADVVRRLAVSVALSREEREVLGRLLVSHVAPAPAPLSAEPVEIHDDDGDAG